MCLIAVAFQQHPNYAVVVAANRDEFYERASAPAMRWHDAPTVVAGRDLVADGTWLGVSEAGRFAGVTNYRELGGAVGHRSRGELVAQYLAHDESPQSYAEAIWRKRHEYSGFSLLLGDRSELWIISNRAADGPQSLSAGIHLLSNRELGAPWPKSQRLGDAMRDALSDDEQGLEDRLFAALGDRTQAADQDLPDTGIDRERERALSPAFIVGDRYGTRCSTVIRIHDAGARLTERSFDAGGNPSNVSVNELRASAS